MHDNVNGVVYDWLIQAYFWFLRNTFFQVVDTILLRPV